MKKITSIGFSTTMILLIITFLLSSCSKDIFHDLTLDEQAFLVYELGEQFKLKNEMTGDTLNFVVSKKSLEYSQDKKYGSINDHYVQEGENNFSANNCKGEILIRKGVDDSFEIGIYFKGSPIEFNFSGRHDSYSFPISLTIGSIEHHKLYLFEAGDTKLFFSKEIGIIKIENASTGNLYTVLP